MGHRWGKVQMYICMHVQMCRSSNVQNMLTSRIVYAYKAQVGGGVKVQMYMCSEVQITLSQDLLKDCMEYMCGGVVAGPSTPDHHSTAA